MLFAAPLAFGAVEGWAWGSIGIVAAVLLAVWGARIARRGALELVWSPLYVPAAGMVVLGAAQLLAGRTLDSAGSREALIKLAADTLIFFLALQFWGAERSHRSPRVDPALGLGPLVTVYAFALALFGILQWYSSEGLIYWRVKTSGWVFGPYVNHNHYAGLMELLIPMAAAYALSRPNKNGGKALLAFLVFLPVISVLLSGSRGGCVALIAELLIIAAVAAPRWRGKSRRFLLAACLLLGAVFAALLFWLGTGAVARRMATLGGLARTPDVTLGRRLTLAQDTLRLAWSHPWAGSGLGSFAVAFPGVQSFASDAVYNHAHNDFLEALSETGAAGGALMALALILFLREAFGDLRAKLASNAGWVRFGAGVGCCGLLVHSLVDFNLHIPANAAWFAFLLGIAVAPRRTASRSAVRA